MDDEAAIDDMAQRFGQLTEAWLAGATVGRHKQTAEARPASQDAPLKRDEDDDQDHSPDHGAGAGALPRTADDRDRRRDGAAVRWRLGDLRPRQRRGLGEALYQVREALPTYRAHNEQAMAHAAIAFAKASFRRRMMAATSSIGPGATNMVTAAALAHVNRLPVLLPARRRLRQPRARPGAAAGRGFRRWHGLGQ
jgi:hypothetical protein